MLEIKQLDRLAKSITASGHSEATNIVSRKGKVLQFVLLSLLLLWLSLLLLLLLSLLCCCCCKDTSCWLDKISQSNISSFTEDRADHHCKTFIELEMMFSGHLDSEVPICSLEKSSTRTLLGRGADFAGTLDTYTRSTYWVTKWRERQVLLTEFISRMFNWREMETEDTKAIGSANNVNISLRHWLSSPM